MCASSCVGATGRPYDHHQLPGLRCIRWSGSQRHCRHLCRRDHLGALHVVRSSVPVACAACARVVTVVAGTTCPFKHRPHPLSSSRRLRTLARLLCFSLSVRRLYPRCTGRGRVRWCVHTSTCRVSRSGMAVVTYGIHEHFQWGLISLALVLLVLLRFVHVIGLGQAVNMLQAPGSRISLKEQVRTQGVGVPSSRQRHVWRLRLSSASRVFVAPLRLPLQ